MFTASNGQKLPDFLIVGAAKSGTTSLFFYLSQHPKIALPIIKEPRFFVSNADKKDGIERAFEVAKTINDLDEYTSIYQKSVEKLCGDASTDYLYLFEESIFNIKKYYGASARSLPIIVMLRNPVERAWSHYMMQKREGKETLSFEEAVSVKTLKQRLDKGWPISFDYLGYGYYASQVNAFRKEFDNVLVLQYEDFERDAASIVRLVWRFLQLDDAAELNVEAKYNVSGVPKGKIHSFAAKLLYKKNPIKRIVKHLLPRSLRYYIRTRASQTLFEKSGVPVETKKFLQERYKDDVSRLAIQQGIDISKWLR